MSGGIKMAKPEDFTLKLKDAIRIRKGYREISFKQIQVKQNTQSNGWQGKMQRAVEECFHTLHADEHTNPDHFRVEKN